MKLPKATRALLRLFPEEFRDAHRAEVEDFVREELERAGERRTRVWIRLSWDLLRSGVSLRIRPVRRGIWALSRNDRGEGWMLGTWNDLGLAVRGLGRSRGFSLVVVTTLALGVGLNTALFSVVNAVLIRPLDFTEPERLVHVGARLDARGVAVTLSGGDLEDLRSGVAAFEATEGVATIRQNLNGAGLPRQIRVGWVSPGFLRLLGVDAALGRVHAADDGPGTVVLSHRLWVDAFGADSDVVGRTVQLDGHTATVVGVMPSRFALPLPAETGALSDIDLWKNPDRFWQNGDIWNAQGPEFGLLRVVARLADGAALEDGQAGVDAVAADLRRRYPGYENHGLTMEVSGLQDHVVAEVRPTLLLLMGAVGLVLLIACANVANLMTVRGRSRARDIAIRLALGSPRGRVGRCMLLESLVLATVGTAIGVGLARWAVVAVPSLAPPQVPLGDVALDATVLSFAMAAAVVATVLVGVLPALTAIRTDPNEELGNGRTFSGKGAALRDALVVSQVALSLMLLVGAGLLTSSLARTQAIELGLEPEGVYSFGISIPGSQYGWPEEAGRFYRSVEARVAELPGVESAGVIWPMPFGGSWQGPHAFDEGEPVDLGLAQYRLATEAYFPTVDIPLVDGRLFRDGDSRHVLIVSESVARAAWPGRTAVGRTLEANPWGGGGEDFEIIGVVGDIRDVDVRDEPAAMLYFDARAWSWVDWEVHVVARTDLAADQLLPGLREEVAALDPSLPLAHPAWLGTALGAQTASTRFVLGLLGLFAATAATLATIGLYGVVSYSVGMRRREFGLRMALGSASAGIQRMVVSRGLRLVAPGVGLGLAGAWFLAGLLEAFLYAVAPTDPITYAFVSLLLVAAALLASWVPAWRASRLDPVQVLRSD